MNTFSFTQWLASRRAVSFALAVGVLFLIAQYQGIIYRADPSNSQLFQYPYFLQVILSHLDSFFFGLATAIIIFQSQKEWHKIVYCTFEGIMIFLNLNRNFIAEVGINSQFLLACYVAIFSAFTLYYLGSLARFHYEEDNAYSTALRDSPETDYQEEKQALKEVEKKSKYLAKYPRLVDDLKRGMSLNNASAKHGVSYSTVQKVKLVMKAI